MTLRLFQRRVLWWPTAPGWVALFLLLLSPILLWWFQGESFLAITHRQPAEILVVEGWVGLDGINAAKTEFEQGGYRYLVTAGGVSKSGWDRRRWNYALSAKSELVAEGVTDAKVIAAPALDSEDHRTFDSALAVQRTLQARGLQPTAINVFTLGVHARRSRLVFAKIFQPATRVGVVSWTPSGYLAGSWWRSSERAEDFIKETVGYFFEALLNSGRTSNAPKAPGS